MSKMQQLDTTWPAELGKNEIAAVSGGVGVDPPPPPKYSFYSQIVVETAISPTPPPPPK